MFIRTAVALLGAVALSAVQAQSGPFQEGVHYERIEPAQPTFAAPGKVEVIEVFSYSCHACAAAQPAVDSWKKSMPAEVQFSYLPAVFQPGWEVTARGYFAADALGLLEKTHQASFDANFKLKQPLSTVDDVAKLYAGFGSSVEEISKVMTGFAVNTRMQRARKQIMAYGVESTPTLVVNGKWRVKAGNAVGSHQGMFSVVNYLVQREAAEARPAAPASGS